MIGRSVVFVCIVACVFIAIECKPLHREHKSLRRNVGHSVLQLKLTKDDINRGISINVNRGGLKLVHRMPVIVEQQKNQRRKFKKSQSNIKKALAAAAKNNENEVALNLAMKTNAKTVMMRSKRSVNNKKDTQIEDLHKFNEESSDERMDFSSSEETETTTRRASSRHGSSQLMQEEEQKKQLKFINSEDYRDYAFDTTDNEHFNEDDDLLQRYYGTKPVRRSTSSNNDDGYGSFTDLLRVSANENERKNQFIRQLHYGNYDGESAMGDEGEDENNEEIYDEYDNYADDDY